MRFYSKLLIHFTICFACAIIRSWSNNSKDPDSARSNNFVPTEKSQSTDAFRVLVEEEFNRATRIAECGSTSECHQLNPPCISCQFNQTCVYGTIVNTTCSPLKDLQCKGEKNFTRSHLCAYCYQLPEDHYKCQKNSTCRPYSRYLAHCEVNDTVLCLGNRNFTKYLNCNFSSGYKWSTALILSITLGGFGIDRFYLGDWQEGLGKFFSFGGLGVWTLIDVILIATGYLKPADGSHFI